MARKTREAARESMRVFEYQEIGSFGKANFISPSSPAETSPSSVSGDQIAARLLQAYEEGLRHGEQKAQAYQSQAVLEERARIAQTINAFDTQVADYYSRIEVEVVKLALAIASKILHREAQVDSLLVAALARVALDKFHGNTKTLIRVRPDETSAWRQYFAQTMEQSKMPEIVEDAAVSPQSCILETDLGSTELGVETQLKEIENGLFDLLAQRPQPK
jgi:flagellar assembly protein FliH